VHLFFPRFLKCKMPCPDRIRGFRVLLLPLREAPLPHGPRGLGSPETNLPPLRVPLSPCRNRGRLFAANSLASQIEGPPGWEGAGEMDPFTCLMEPFLRVALGSATQEDCLFVEYLFFVVFSCRCASADLGIVQGPWLEDGSFFGLFHRFFLEAVDRLRFGRRNFWYRSGSLGSTQALQELVNLPLACESPFPGIKSIDF